MKRLQIHIEDSVDEALGRLAVREGTSKAALIRAYVAERLGAERAERDPLDELLGRYDARPGSIDELVRMTREVRRHVVLGRPAVSP